jgi:hypothetical protein
MQSVLPSISGFCKDIVLLDQGFAGTFFFGYLVAIASLSIGDKVLAYNESTKQQGEYAITKTHKNLDAKITYLTLETDSKEIEQITTTPEHPFYLEQNADNSKRPKPVGHADFSSNWVGAGHLMMGDRVNCTDGSNLVCSDEFEILSCVH